MSFRLPSLFDLRRILRLTALPDADNGVEITGRVGADPPIIKPFSNAGETDVNLYLFGLGTGLVYANGDIAESRNYRGVADGYAPLDASALIPFANLGTGTATGTKFLRDDRTWAVPAAVVADGDKGDITVSVSGTVWTIDTDAVTYAKIQDVTATDRLLGRSTAGAGIVEEIVCTAAGRAVLDDATAADQRATLGAQPMMGFPLSATGTPSVTVTYDTVARTVTLTAVSGATFTVYVDGVGITVASPYTSTAHAATTGNHFLYHTGVAWTWATSPWDLLLHAPACLVYYSALAGSGVAFVETHTISRSTALHRRLHEVEGTVLVSGGLLADYTLATDSDAGVTYSISQAVIADEDLHHTITAIADGGPYTIWYRSGASGEWTWTTGLSLPWTAGTYAQRNENTGATWQLTDIGINDFGTFYVVALGSVTSGHGFAIVPGQTSHSTLGAAQTESFSALSLGSVAWQEFAVVAKVIVQCKASYGGTSKTRIEQVDRLTGSRSLSVSLGSAQPLDTFLTSIAALGTAADRMIYTTAVDTAAEATITSAGRALLDDATAADQRTTLGLGSLATQSGTFSGTSSGTNTGDQTITLTGGVTGSGTGSFATTVVTNANLTGPITSVGNATTIADAELAALAGLVSAADGLPYFTGSGTAALATLTSFARTILDDADAATVRATIGAGTGSGDALTTNTLAQFASTTSLQLLGVMSDETGTGSLVFGTSPTLTTPRIAQINGALGEIVATFSDIASAANYFAFQSRVAGAKPRLSATGSDTNVGLVLGTKGTGILEVAPGGTSLREIVDVGASGENRTMVGKLTFPSGATNAPAIPDFVNSTHTHTNAAGGGTLDASAIGSGTMATARLGSGSPSATNALLGNQSYGNPAPAAHATSHKNGGSDEIATATAAANAIPKAGANALLDEAWIPDAGPNRYLKAGTTSFTAYYAANLATGVALTTLTLTAGRGYAVPFIAPARGATIDELEVYVTTGVAATNVRFGIYSNISESGLWPNALVLDCGAFTSTASSTKRTASISQALTPGALYWFVLVSDGAPAIRAGSTNQASHLLGTASSANTTYTTHVYATLAYGALPATFPTSGATAATGAFPAIFCRMSA